MYLVSCCNYLPEPDNVTVLRSAYDIYTKMTKYVDAMRIALKMNSKDDVESTFIACTDIQERRQLCHLLARHGFVIDLEDGRAAVEDSDEREALVEIMSNSKLSEYYLMLARDLDVMDPKTPQDVYKSHLVRPSLLPLPLLSCPLLLLPFQDYSRGKPERNGKGERRVGRRQTEAKSRSP